MLRFKEIKVSSQKNVILQYIKIFNINNYFMVHKALASKHFNMGHSSK